MMLAESGKAEVDIASVRGRLTQRADNCHQPKARRPCAGRGL